MHELPEGQRINVELHPDGTTTIRMLEEDVSDEVACCLGDVLTCVKQNVYYPLFLACAGMRTPAAAS